MSNVTNLFPEKVSGQETIVEFLQNMEFDDILILAKKDGIPFMLTTVDSLEKTILTLEEIKLSLLMGDTEEV